MFGASALQRSRGATLPERRRDAGTAMDGDGNRMSQPRSDHHILEVSEAGVDAAAVARFLEAHWQRRVALSSTRFFDWQFAHPPASEGRNRCLVVLDRHEAIQGFMGVTPREFWLDGRRVAGAELTTWVLSEATRGLGLGKAIVRTLQQRYDAIIGMGISDSALPIYAAHGLKYMRYLPRYVRVFDADRVAPISRLEPLGERLIRQSPPPIDVRFDASAVSFEDGGDLAERTHQRFNAGGRNVTYLRWRYSEHPVYAYEAFRIHCDAGEAAIVVRVDDVGALRVLHAVDFLGDVAAVPATLAFLEQLGLERSIALADFYCSADPIGHQLWSRGWFSAVDDYHTQVPNWFYPIDMRTPPTTSLILWARDDVGALLDRSRAYITKGDCDMDRPTLHYYEAKGLAI